SRPGASSSQTNRSGRGQPPTTQPGEPMALRVYDRGEATMQAQSQTSTTTTQPQAPVQTSALKVKTHVKAGNDPIGSTGDNHNATLVRRPRPSAGLKVKTHVKGGGVIIQHYHRRPTVP